jgi:hypothetical protein
MTQAKKEMYKFISVPRESKDYLIDYINNS